MKLKKKAIMCTFAMIFAVNMAGLQIWAAGTEERSTQFTYTKQNETSEDGGYN